MDRSAAVTTALIPVAWLAGGYLAATWAGTALDGRPGGLAAATAVGVAVVGVGLLPAALAWRLHAGLRGRGLSTAGSTVWAVTTVLAALAALVGAQTSRADGVAGLLRDRGTWLFDAATGGDPHGSAALPAVEAQVAALAGPIAPHRAAGLLCADAARAIAEGVIEAAREPSEIPGPSGATLDALAARAATDGPAALIGATDALSATAAPADLAIGVPAAVTLAAADRGRLTLAGPAGETLDAALTADGWRVCVPPDTARTAGRAYVAEVRAAALAARPAPVLPDPDEATVRALVRRVVEGRAAWALAVPAAPGFAAAFEPAAAVAEAERIRGWCRAWATGDPALAGSIQTLDARWAATPERLPAEGGALLTEVETACASVAAARVLVEGARGVPAGAEERRRWARLDGEAAAAAALLTRDGAGFRVVLPTDPSGAGPALTVVPSGGGFRVAAIR